LLQGNVIVGVAAMPSSLDHELDTTHLWHMRLEHMLE